MKEESSGLIIGISIGVVIGVVLAILAFLCFRYQRKRSQIGNSSSRRATSIPIRANGADSCTIMSDSSLGTESPRSSTQNGMSLWLGGIKNANVVSASGILEYSYKDLQKATFNFTTLIGQGAFGPVYKAQMSTGETVAVKVLATDSKQGEKEFQTEVMFVNDYHKYEAVRAKEEPAYAYICLHEQRKSGVSFVQPILEVTKMKFEQFPARIPTGLINQKNCGCSQLRIITVLIINKSSGLRERDEKLEPLNWELRVQIALDVARGLEYLHDGAVPPVIHRDIKSSNILLDQFMRARVADFGLSREEMVSKHASNIQGTFGYLDPEYISTRSYTKKSDVYSYGVLLFELIAGRNPLQGLMEYVELAAMNTEGKVGWEEIVDLRLDGKFDDQELNEVAALAYKCVNCIPRRRPSIRDNVQVLSRILKSRHNGKHTKDSSNARADEVSINMDQLEHQSPIPEHHQVESMDSTVDSVDV